MSRWIIEIGTDASVEGTVRYTGSKIGAVRKARKVARQIASSRYVDLRMVDEESGRPCGVTLGLHGELDLPDHDSAMSASALVAAQNSDWDGFNSALDLMGALKASLGNRSES